MNLEQAKAKLDNLIRISRVHFYKPFQIAEILRHHRFDSSLDLSDLSAYRNSSRRWRDEVTLRLVGRSSTSSAKYQDDLFNATACPPEAITELGVYNAETSGAVEAYIYRKFVAKVSAVADILAEVKKATPETFDLDQLVKTFERKPGLKRSIDKVFEITVYALFSTVVKALKLQVSISVGNVDKGLMHDFADFLNKVVGLKEGETQLVRPASLFRLGSTNAADRGLDMVANFGPAIQVKHLTLKAAEIGDICDGITADRIVIVCKDTEVQTIDLVIQQLGLQDRLQSLVTFSDLKKWYEMCLDVKHRNTVGTTLLKDFIREFASEFPSLEGMPGFMGERGYGSISLPKGWII